LKVTTTLWPVAATAEVMRRQPSASMVSGFSTTTSAPAYSASTM
jgi:hypothetical protein